MKKYTMDALCEIVEIFEAIKEVCDRAHSEQWGEEEQADAFYQIMDEVMRWEVDN